MTATYLILQHDLDGADEEYIDPQINNLVVKELRQAVFDLFPVHIKDILWDAKYGDDCEYEGIDGLKWDVIHTVFGSNYDDNEIGDAWETIVEEMIFTIFDAARKAYSQMTSYLLD